MLETQSYTQTTRPSLMEWEVSERTHQTRSVLWYIVAGTLAVVLLAYSVYTANFLFAIMILLLAFILVIQEIVPPKVLTVRLTGSGIWIGNSHYAWTEFKGFYLIYQPPEVEKFYLEFDSPKSDMSLDIVGLDPLAIREIMLKILPEDLQNEDESTTDSIRRMLKI